MKAKTALLTLAALAMLAMPAVAEETAAPAPADQFAAADANKDGALSKEEWPDADAFAKADANGDGSVSREEFDAAQAPAAPAE